jgi:hypothetical protein
VAAEVSEANSMCAYVRTAGACDTFLCVGCALPLSRQGSAGPIIVVSGLTRANAGQPDAATPPDSTHHGVFDASS